MERKNAMFMWTLRRSDLVNVVMLFVAGVLALSSVHANAVAPLKKADAAVIKNLESNIAALFKGRDDFPEAPISSIRLNRNLFWSTASGGVLIAPVTVRFKGISNSYCRLVTFSRDEKTAVLVDVPERVNFDECKGFRKTRYLEVNGDGMLDIVAVVSIKSNAFDGYVDEPMVYLSGKDRAGGYCYSEVASRNMVLESMISDDKLLQALEEEKKRLAISQFECSSTAP